MLVCLRALYGNRHVRGVGPVKGELYSAVGDLGDHYYSWLESRAADKPQ